MEPTHPLGRSQGYRALCGRLSGAGWGGPRGERRDRRDAENAENAEVAGRGSATATSEPFPGAALAC